MCVTSVKKEFWQYELEKPVKELNEHVWGGKATTVKRVALAIVLPIMYIGLYALALIGRIFKVRNRVSEMEYRSLARITDEHGVTKDAKFKEYIAGVSAQIMPKLQEMIDQGCTKLRWYASTKYGDEDVSGKFGAGKVPLSDIDQTWLERRFSRTVSGSDPKLQGVLSGKFEFEFYIVGTKDEERFGYGVHGKDADAADDSVLIEWKMNEDLIVGDDQGRVYEAAARDIGREPNGDIKAALSKP